ncbi:MAG TPA: AvrE-family type 3 secretion system effector [Duganella sp.]|uniref:AvrE-family type 3 secretion system effector n=1 Tax=Duganella sp. TaxID=1904440 RepID=UPI002ED52C90
MVGSVTNPSYSVSIELPTPSPSNSETHLNRHQQPLSPMSPGVETPRITDRSHAWRAKLTVQAGPDGPVSRAASKAINQWLQRRPGLDSCTTLHVSVAGGTHPGGMLYRYQASPSEPHAARCEAFYTTVPGVLVAALTVHPQAELRAGRAEPPAADVASQLSDPPIGLLTGVWQNKAGDAFHLHNNLMHKMTADGEWAPHPMPGASSSTARLHMLGRQADGQVYAQLDGNLLKLVANDAQFVGRPGGGALARVDENGVPVLLRGAALVLGGIRRPLALMRENADHAWEPSPAEPKDFVAAGDRQFVVLYNKGRLYDADGAAAGRGPIDARRIDLPLPGGTRDWVVTALGQGGDASIHAIAQHRDGQRVALQRRPGAEAFEPAFMLDHPVLLVARQGLHAPDDERIESRVALDGHARLGQHAGMVFFRESGNPRHPWAALNGPDGQPLYNVETVIASPFGFVDRKPAFALLRGPAGGMSIVHLNLQGRTTFLPAGRDGGGTPAGGPLTVVPAQVHAAPVVLAAHDQAIGDFAVNKERQVFFLERHGGSRKILTNQPGPPGAAAGLRDLNGERALVPLSLALALDNCPHVLHRHADDVVSLKRLDPVGGWQDVALDLSDLAPGARMRQLRSSRTGQLEVKLASDDDPGGSWHAVLPRLTVTDAAGGKQLAPARVLPLRDQQPRDEDGQNAGTNALINRQQASRLPVGNAFASVRTTLAGNLSTDPLTMRSPVQSLMQSTADHTRKVLDSLANTVFDSARAFANSLGFTAMPAPQFERLKGHFHEAQLVHAELRAADAEPALAHAFQQAFAPPGDAPASPSRGTLGGILHADRAIALGAGARVETLESLLFDLRKVGIKDRALDPSLDPKPDLYSGANVTYKGGDGWRAVTRGLGGQGDLLPGLLAAFARLPPDAELGNLPGLGERERGLLIEVRALLRALEAGGARIPGAPDTVADDGADQARRDLRDPHAIRSANIARAHLQYTKLLEVNDIGELRHLEAAQRQSAASGLGRLAKLGISSWNDLEALDDIVATFRADMDNPKSARRQQLLKSMGLPADAPRDVMAACMTDVLQDLYNRSTFFSTTSDTKSVSVSILSDRMQVLGYGAAPGVAGEHIHALGVERIGDSLEGDAGLVAFFVRHNKASMTLLGSKGIDINPAKEGEQEDRTVSPFKNQLNKAAKGIASFSLSAAGRLSVAVAMQHGVGAAVILSPETIPEFARLLFDSGLDDAAEVLAIGVNRGGIGLDLFETNLDVRGALAVNANFSAQPKQTFGTPLPADPANPGAAGVTESRRGTWSANAGAAITADFGLHWNEMELHLDHAWKNILGLEYQGRFDFNTSLDVGLNLASAFSVAIGKVVGDLDALIVPNMSNIRLGGVNLAMGNGNFFGAINPVLNGLKELANRIAGMDGNIALAPATYKRTLDAEATALVDREQWQGMGAKLLKAFPQATDLEFPALPGDRYARIEELLGRIQGREALGIERAAAPDDQLWQGLAREATARAVLSGEAWRPKSEAARAEVLNELKLMRQQDDSAVHNRAMLIPGARIEINTLGKGALDQMVAQAVGHWHLGSKMAELDAARKQIPGLAGVLKTIKDNSENISQVRFVFEMRPQALRGLNDAMALRRRQLAAAAGGPALTDAELGRLAMPWHEVMHKARSAPELYRLAVIVPHNTDDNPSAVNVGMLGFSHGRTANAPHQLFQSEVQLRYDMYDRLIGAEILEGAVRALDKDFEEMRREGVAPLAIPKPPLGDEYFAPPSPVGRRIV